MFSFASNGSKVALIALCQMLCRWGFPLLDAQVESPHLVSLGAFEIERGEFVSRVSDLSSTSADAGSWTDRWNIRHASDLA
jgi:leucyl/phenylalanyl-tRNA--protein transferase